MLSACGGGGGGSGGGNTVTVPPTPTPTPTPTPAASYTEASDFSVNRDYTGWGAQLVRTHVGVPAGSPPGTSGSSTFEASLAAETRAAGFSYTAATKTYVVRWLGAERSFITETSLLFQGIIPSDTATDFVRSHFYATPTTPDYTHYIGFVNWSAYEGAPGNGLLDSVSRYHLSIFGAPTAPSDLLSTGTTHFELQGTRYAGGPSTDHYNVGEQYQVSVNWETGAVTGTIVFQPSPSAPAGTLPMTLTVSGTVNKGSSRVTGTIAGSFSGSFSGAVFGPQGREMGFAMTLSNGAGGRIAGVAGGRGLGLPPR